MSLISWALLAGCILLCVVAVYALVTANYTRPIILEYTDISSLEVSGESDGTLLISGVPNGLVHIDRIEAQTEGTVIQILIHATPRLPRSPLDNNLYDIEIPYIDYRLEVPKEVTAVVLGTARTIIWTRAVE